MATITAATDWISSSFSQKKIQGKTAFTVSGVPLERIVKQYPPPFYLYDADTISRQTAGIQSALSPFGIQIYYSVKANTSLAVVREIYHSGCGLEVASLGELLVAEKLQVDFQKVSYAGPVKTDEELTKAITLQVGTIHVENMNEFYRINAIARKKGICQRVGIRINPVQLVAEAGGYMGGGSMKFGFDEETLTKSFFQEIQSLPYITLSGIHVFAATQILSAGALMANIENTCTIAEKILPFFPLRYIDFGGGFGIPYAPEDTPLPLTLLSKKLDGVLSKFHFLKEKAIELYIEPGRYIVGNCGIYVVKVANVKSSRGVTMLLVDGGIHHMLRPALAIGSATHPIRNISKCDQTSTGVFDIGGSLCTSLDFLGKNVPLPDTIPGDILGVFNAGAYGWSEAMPYFLSHQTAAELLVKNKRVFLIRSSVPPSAFFDNQILPEYSGGYEQV